MNRILRDVRLIPIVLLATICLFALKVSGLVFDGGYTLADRLQARDKNVMKIVSADSVPAQPKIVDERAPGYVPDAQAAAPASWAQQMFNFNDQANHDITGSVGSEEQKPAESVQLKTSNKAPEPPKLEVAGASLPLEQGKVSSPGERALLERLQERRQELDSRSRDLDMRENLIKAAEKRLESRAMELKDLQSKVDTAVGNRDAAEASRFKSIVTMYENMKPKDAARIFDRLDLKVLIEVATLMNPRKMSDILGQMAPDSAERLTVELANRANAQVKTPGANDLPKIEGKPGG
jgi:flagellar motility protein MotE (MotC chaperone)